MKKRMTLWSVFILTICLIFFVGCGNDDDDDNNNDDNTDHICWSGGDLFFDDFNDNNLDDWLKNPQ